METLKINKFLILAIIGNFIFVYADFLTFGKFKISLITIIFGYFPLSIQIIRTIQRSKNRN
jgi:hypothetical protein